MSGVPTSYTEDQLKAMMHTAIGRASTLLGWSVAGGSYDEAVIDVLNAYGVNSIDKATDIKKLRDLARREVWRAVMNATAGEYTFSADGATMNRSDVHAMAEQNFNVANIECLAYSNIYQVGVTKVNNANDPYRNPDEEETI